MSVQGYPLAINFKSVSWKSLLSNISGNTRDQNDMPIHGDLEVDVHKFLANTMDF